MSSAGPLKFLCTKQGGSISDSSSKQSDLGCVDRSFVCLKLVLDVSIYMQQTTFPDAFFMLTLCMLANFACFFVVC